MRGIKRVLKKPVKQALTRMKRKRIEAVDYVNVFSNVIGPMYAEYDDGCRGWTRLTSFDYVKTILAELKSGKILREAQKLSVWLTFQMYRGEAGLEAPEVGNDFLA